MNRLPIIPLLRMPTSERIAESLSWGNFWRFFMVLSTWRLGDKLHITNDRLGSIRNEISMKKY